jgi:hypothetical protein
MLTALTINNTYEPMSFRSVENAFKLWMRGKVEVIEEWDETFTTSASFYPIPSIVRFLYRVPHRPRRHHYNRGAVLMRDQYTCQYCGRQLHKDQLTIDHIVPKSKGGENGWLNCVAACKECNRWKGQTDLSNSGMSLIRRPIVPNLSVNDDLLLQSVQHPSWKQYLC